MRMRKILATMGLASISLLALSGCSANAEYQVERYENLNGVAHVLIDATSSNITIVPSTDGTISVECKNMEKMKYYVGVEGDTLVVKYNPEWHQWLFSGALFRNDETSATIYLPEGEYRQLTVDMTSGSFVLPEGYTFGTADVEVTSGSLKFGADVAGELDAECTSGEIVLSGVSCKSLDVEATSGKIELVDIAVSGDLDAECSSGEIVLSGVSCEQLGVEVTSGEIELVDVAVSGDLDAKCSSGEISFSNVTAGNVYIGLTSGDVRASGLIAFAKMKMKATSGGIILDRCDAAELDLTLTSGELRATLLTPKYYNVKVTSGKVNVPDDDISGGKCTIHVTSGRVDLSIVKE